MSHRTGNRHDLNWCANMKLLHATVVVVLAMLSMVVAGPKESLVSHRPIEDFAVMKHRGRTFVKRGAPKCIGQVDAITQGRFCGHTKDAEAVNTKPNST